MKNDMKKQLLTLLVFVPASVLLAQLDNQQISSTHLATTKNVVTLNQKKMDTLKNSNQRAWDIYEKYLEGWKPVSKEEREIAAQIMVENVEYRTPRHESGDRYTAIKDMEAFQARLPGGHVEIRDVSAYSDVALVTWDLIQANGESTAKGPDQLRISKEGKITGLITFAPPVSLNRKQMKDTLTSSNQKLWDIYEKYAAGWKPISKKEREIAAQIMAENIEYRTPSHDSGDRNTAIKDMEAFQAKFPGGHFEIREVSSHHDLALVTWELIQVNGESFAKGHDQLRISTEGKIIGLRTFPPSVSKP